MEPGAIIVRCPNCGTQNRVRLGNLGLINRCGNCKRDLTDVFTASGKCLICGAEALGVPLTLSNGSTYHQACLDGLIRCDRAMEGFALSLRQEIVQTKKAIEKENSLARMVGRLISRKTSALPALRKKLSELGTSPARADHEKLAVDRFLGWIYDYWLGYPPDWDRRRRYVLNRDLVCVACGASGGLHVHHIVAIARGGGRGRPFS